MVTYIETKSILSRLNKPDPWFGISYNMNIYRGCQHGCIYCDTRSECYRVGDISNIRIKKNALELLSTELYSKRRKRGTIGTGSMNDPYMPIEKETRLVRGALKVIEREKFPVHIITKSTLVERDIDLLQEISKRYAAVSFTVTTAEDELSGKIEPYAPVTSERFKTLSKLADKGIYTGVTLMPVLPFINDTYRNIESILRLAADSGASYVLPMFGVTLRKGSREYFYRQLDQQFPGIKERYKQYFGEQYICESPESRVLYDSFREITTRFKIDSKMEFFNESSGEQLSLFG